MNRARNKKKKKSRLLAKWAGFREMLEKGDPRRIFAGRFSSEKTRVIQTAKNAPRRHQKVTRRKRVLIARKKRITRALGSVAKFALFTAVLTLLLVDVLGYMRSSPRFSISHIDVSGNYHVTAHQIIAQSGIAEGDNIFRVNLSEAARAITQISWVHGARVRRELPDEIHIQIDERRPIALVLSDSFFRIDKDGMVVAEFESSEGINSPIITSKNIGALEPGETVKIECIDEALEIVQLMKTMDLQESIRISEINIDNPSNITMVAERTGATIIIGSGDLEGKLWRLSRIADAINRNGRHGSDSLKKLDMRFEAIVPARFQGN